jgi:hypothetical protein
MLRRIRAARRPASCGKEVMPTPPARQGGRCRRDRFPVRDEIASQAVLPVSGLSGQRRDQGARRLPQYPPAGY